MLSNPNTMRGTAQFEGCALPKYPVAAFQERIPRNILCKESVNYQRAYPLKSNGERYDQSGNG
jgi:hypothetical protein